MIHAILLKRVSLGFLCLSQLCFSQASLSKGTPPTSIHIDARKTLHVIPRTIYGTFLEPIGNSTYNGLWSEILENPSFEEGLWSAAGVRRMTEAEPALI